MANSRFLAMIASSQEQDGMKMMAKGMHDRVWQEEGSECPQCQHLYWTGMCFAHDDRWVNNEWLNIPSATGWMEDDSIQLSFHSTNYISAQMNELINEWMNMHQWMVAAYSHWFPSYPAQYQSWMTQHYSLLIGVVAMVWCAFPCHYTFCSGAHDDYDIQIREIRVFSR